MTLVNRFKTATLSVLIVIGAASVSHADSSWVSITQKGWDHSFAAAQSGRENRLSVFQSGYANLSIHEN